MNEIIAKKAIDIITDNLKYPKIKRLSVDLLHKIQIIHRNLLTSINLSNKQILELFDIYTDQEIATAFNFSYNANRFNRYKILFELSKIKTIQSDVVG